MKMCDDEIDFFSNVSPISKIAEIVAFLREFLDFLIELMYIIKINYIFKL